MAQHIFRPEIVMKMALFDNDNICIVISPLCSDITMVSDASYTNSACGVLPYNFQIMFNHLY